MSDGDVTITAADFFDDGANLQLHIHLENQTDRTMHACATMRGMRYDSNSRTMEVQLSDRGLHEPTYGGSFILPRFTSVDPKGRTTIELALPRTIARLAPGRNQIAPTIQELPAFEAEQVDIEVAHSDTPFYRDPRPTTVSPRQMVVRWATGHARYRAPRKDPPAKP
jgi:hypothetical protein